MSGFNQAKQGYYLTEERRIIGAIYRKSASEWYIINCGIGTDEAGQNARGSWERWGDVQRVWGTQLIYTPESTECNGLHKITMPSRMAWPIVFKEGETPHVSYSIYHRNYTIILSVGEVPTYVYASKMTLFSIDPCVATEYWMTFGRGKADEPTVKKDNERSSPFCDIPDKGMIWHHDGIRKNQ